MLLCNSVDAQTLKNSIEDVKRLLPLVLKKAWLPLVCLHFGKEISLQILNYAGILLQREGREDIGLLIAVVGTNFFFEILWSAVWSFAAISATRAAMREEPVFNPQSLSDLNQLLIEGVRSMAAIVYRLPLLLIPAAIEVFRLLFVPHIVLLDPLYRAGQVDALKRSRSFIKEAWFTLFLMVAGFFLIGVVVDSITQGASGEPWFWEKPFSFLLSSLLTLFINLVYEVFLVAVFVRLSLKIAAGPRSGPPEGSLAVEGESHAHVQLETS